MVIVIKGVDIKPVRAGNIGYRESKTASKTPLGVDIFKGELMLFNFHNGLRRY